MCIFLHLGVVIDHIFHHDSGRSVCLVQSQSIWHSGLYGNALVFCGNGVVVQQGL